MLECLLLLVGRGWGAQQTPARAGPQLL